MADAGHFDARLADALENARRTYAAFRPEVAAYLYERGFVPTAAALPASEHREALLTHLFRLHLETVGTRMFGVSTDAWRDNPAYPDRYFPTVWLDVVPKVLPRLPHERRLATLATLFNLGENIAFAARAMGAGVAAVLARELDAIVDEGVEVVALDALAELGLVPKNAARPKRAPAKSARFAPLAPIVTAEADPRFIPVALAIEGSTCLVYDWVRPLALAYSLAGATPQLLGRKALPAPAEGSEGGLSLATETTAGKLEVALDGTVTLTPRTPKGANAGPKQRLGAIDPRGLVAVAASETVLALARRFSQRIELIAIGG